MLFEQKLSGGETMKKFLLVFLAMCMVLTVSALASGEPGLTITEVAYGDKYIATTATADDSINSPSASSNIVSVTLSDGTVIEAEDGGVLTLVVNGDHYDIIDYMEEGTVLTKGSYSFATTAATNASTEMAKFMNMAGNTAQYTYRSALYIDENGINADETIPALLAKATYDENGITGELNSYGPFFNGIIVDSAEYTISDMAITGIGDGANDFQGNGAMVLAKGTSDVTIENSTIITEGVIRTAAAVLGNGILRINDSVIYAQETADTQEEYDALVVPMMKRTPFALGLEGVVRTTNVLGAGQGIYDNSLIVSTGWGVLSTDSGNGYDRVGTYALDVSNTTAGTGTVEVLEPGASTDGYFDVRTVGGVTYGYKAGGSGYVAYADSGVWDKFDNVKFYGGNEVQIMASSNSSAFYTNSLLESGHIGVMTQQNAGGTISIVDSTLNVGETGVQIKSGAANNGYTNVILDNTDVNFTTDAIWGGTLVELVESDDAGNPGNTSFTINDLGDVATQATATTVVSDSSALLANGEYTGNIWNNIYNKFQALNVTLDNAVVNGTISSSYGYHLNDDGTRMENGTVLQADTTGNYLVSGASDYHKIGAQYNVANKQVSNPINLTLTNGATWNVVLADGTCGEAEACHINNLTVEAGTAIEAAEPVTIHVYGELDIQGEVGKNVTIVEEDYIPRNFKGNTLTAFDMADPRHTATFVFVKADGSAVNGVAAFEAYKAFATSYFTLATGSYEVVSMEVTEGDATISAITPDNPDGYYGEYDYNIAMNTDCTVTVVLEGSAPAVASGEASGEPS